MQEIVDKVKSIVPSKKKGQKNTDALKCVDQIESDLKSHRKQFEGNWSREEEVYYGRMWRNKTKRQPFENLVFEAIESEVPVLTDSVPSVVAKPKDDEFEDQAKSLTAAVEWVFSDQKFDIKYPDIVRKTLIGGPSYVFAYYDAKANDGNGQVVNEVLHWSQVWLSGEEFIEKTSKAKFKVPRTKDWLKSRYPNFKEEIDKLKGEEKGQSGNFEGLETRDTQGRYYRTKPQEYRDKDLLDLVYVYKKDESTLEDIPEEITLKELEKDSMALQSGEPMDVNLYQDHPRHIEAKMQIRAALLEELGLPIQATADMAYEQATALAEQNPEAAEGFQEQLAKLAMVESNIEAHKALLRENPKGQRLKYPGGYRVIEKVDQVILYDGPIKGEKTAKTIPLAPFYCYKVGAYSHSEVREIMDSVEMHSIMTYKQYKGLQRIANPIVVANKASQITEENFSNEDGAFYSIPDGGILEYKNPGNISPQLEEFCQNRKRSIKDISGINETVEGRQVHADQSGVAVGKTQDQAIGRIRLKDRNNQRYSIKRLGILNAHLVLEHWDDEKMLRVQDGRGGYEQIIFDPAEVKDLEFDIEISDGSMAGVDKDKYNALLTTWLVQGQITFKEYLQTGEFPRKNKLLSMVSEREDMEAQMQELQMQNLQLKAQFAPETLTPEEVQLLEAQQSGVNPTNPQGV